MKATWPTLTEVLQIPDSECGEKLFCLQEYAPDIKYQYEKDDMKELLGESMYVRSTVAAMLVQATTALQAIDPSYNLQVAYAYRAPVVQRRYFERRQAAITAAQPTWTITEINEETHLYVAHPDVAGHPTGAALDLAIIKDGLPLDMGTRIADFSNEEAIEVFYDKLTPAQHEHRQLLRRVMLSVGFAPFDKEWWHFSYGDRDWAWFYKKEKAIYDNVSLDTLK